LSILGDGRRKGMISRCVLLGLGFGLGCFAGNESIRISVMEGEGAINNVRLQRAKVPVIRVETETGAPVSGAFVHFLAPTEGPGGVFLDGSSTSTVMTDTEGRASARGFRPNKTVGQFQIRVTVSYSGKTANARIIQTNAESAAARQISSKKIALLAIVGVAVAGGAAMVARGGGGSKTPAAAPGTVIAAGNPAFGPP
jgi:hypothetical protein